MFLHLASDLASSGHFSGVCIFVHIYIYAVELKTGPRFGVSSVKNWSKSSVKNWSKFFFCCFFPSVIVFFGHF